MCKRSGRKNILVVADGAAFGPEMERALSLKKAKNVVYFLPESFEWILLKSGLVEEKDIKDILENPSKFIESEKYFSWERFFTALLIEKTKNSPFEYSKHKLNPIYLHEKNKIDIITEINEVAGKELF